MTWMLCRVSGGGLRVEDIIEDSSSDESSVHGRPVAVCIGHEDTERDRGSTRLVTHRSTHRAVCLWRRSTLVDPSSPWGSRGRVVPLRYLVAETHLPHHTPLTPRYSRIKPSVICNFWHPGALTLSSDSERQSARMSKITNDGLSRSGTGCNSDRQRVNHKFSASLITTK